MTRERLPNKHFSTTTSVAWQSPAGPDTKLIVTLGFDEDGFVREIFCASFRAHSDICALANDACILASRLLQHGERVDELATKLGENRLEGQTSGPPASMVGAILRKAAEVERELRANPPTGGRAA